MTREVKLSLILGFAVVLIVGVLLSDHLSGARRVSIDGLNPEQGVSFGAVSGGIDSPGLILVDEHGRPQATPRQERQQPTSPPRPIDQAAGIIAESPTINVDAYAGNGEITMLSRLQERFRQGLTDAVTELAEGNAPPGAFVIDVDDSAREPDRPAIIPIRETRQAASSQTPSLAPRTYQVKQGDTLWSIAARELGDGRRHAEITALNRDRLGANGTLRAGATIRLPAAAAQAAPSRNQPQAQQQASRPAAQERPSRQAAQSTYTVRSGDTLSRIAARVLGSAGRYEDILLANADTLDDEHSLRPGMVLKIPTR